MIIVRFIALVSLIIPLVHCEEREEQLRQRACDHNSCHPQTQCHAVRTKEERSDKWVFKPVCMKVPTCASKKCEPGEKCALKPVRCQLYPCFEVPTCLPDISEAIPEFQMPPALLV